MTQTTQRTAPPPSASYQPPAEHRRIGIRAVCALCGDVSTMWVHRRLADSDFPRPHYVGRRRFWREADVIAWLDAREREGAAA